MSRDPIVAEVRRIREEYSAKFNNNVHAMAEYARKREQELKDSGYRVVSLEKKRKTG